MSLITSRYFSTAMGVLTTLLTLANVEVLAQDISSRAEGKAYYDCTQDITWTTDADLARTMGYDEDGRMNWPKGLQFIDHVNSVNYLGDSNWRLPKGVDVGKPGKQFTYCGITNPGDGGYWTIDSELPFMFYKILGAKPKVMGCDAVKPGKPGDMRPWEEVGTKAVDTAPFTGIQDYGAAPVPHVGYWTGDHVVGAKEDLVWQFHFNYGSQHPDGKMQPDVVWPVLDGDPLLKPGDLTCDAPLAVNN
jgi:hypothetical protein